MQIKLLEIDIAFPPACKIRYAKEFYALWISATSVFDALCWIILHGILYWQETRVSLSNFSLLFMSLWTKNLQVNLYCQFGISLFEFEFITLLEMWLENILVNGITVKSE